MRARLATTAFLLLLAGPVLADEAAIARSDYQIDSVDPGIRISVREVIPSGTSAFAEDRVVLFVHGAGAPSRPAFDIPDRSASWAEWMARRGYAVYLFDFRNCGWSTREPAMVVGRPLFNASSIYAPTLVIAGAADRLVGPDHRQALLRDLVHAAVKREVVVPGATHVAQFEHRRDELFKAVEAFLAEPTAPPAR